MVLGAMEVFYAREGYFPSTRELAYEVGWSSSGSVHPVLQELEYAGYVVRYGPQNRYRRTGKTHA
jgi:DNA-binding MarR family transcriptional regulator